MTVSIDLTGTGCQSTGVTARRTADVMGALVCASGATDSLASGDGSLLSTGRWTT